ncbi:MAG: hypothetical protein RL262_1187, partial [Bacteroidota bacterium]
MPRPSATEYGPYYQTYIIKHIDCFFNCQLKRVSICFILYNTDYC